MGRNVERAVAILNGVVGDYLARTDNGLATQMTFVRDERPISPNAAIAGSRNARVVVLVHGLMNDETIWEFAGGGASYGSRLAKDADFVPLYVRYNSGLEIAENGAALSKLIDELISAHPQIREVLLLGYSMGGLVIRSACHVASVKKHAWLRLVRRAIYVGTPHRGAPMERVGKLVAKVLHQIDDPYVRLAAQLGDLRSRGIKDLGDPQHPIPLLPSIRHYLVAGTLSSEPWLALLFGDSIVPVSSATDGACISADTLALPPSHVRVFERLGHLELPRNAEVYEAVLAFCTEEAAP